MEVTQGVIPSEAYRKGDSRDDAANAIDPDEREGTRRSCSIFTSQPGCPTITMSAYGS